MKPGQCPKQHGTSPICKKACANDFDCNIDDHKCCDVGCGTRTCVRAGKVSSVIII